MKGCVRTISWFHILFLFCLNSRCLYFWNLGKLKINLMISKAWNHPRDCLALLEWQCMLHTHTNKLYYRDCVCHICIEAANKTQSSLEFIWSINLVVVYRTITICNLLKLEEPPLRLHDEHCASEHTWKSKFEYFRLVVAATLCVRLYTVEGMKNDEFENTNLNQFKYISYILLW